MRPRPDPRVRRGGAGARWPGAAGLAAALLLAAGAPGASRAAKVAKVEGTAAEPGTMDAVHVDVRGAVALVTVSHAVPAPRPGRAAETVFDIALPERSALLDVEIQSIGGGRFERLAPRKTPEARDGYLASLGALGIEPASLPFDDEARYRIRVAARNDRAGAITGGGAPLWIRYSFSTILEAHGGRCQITFPAALDLSPAPAVVKVRAEPRAAIGEIAIAGNSHPIAAGAPALSEAVVSMKSRWSVSLALAGSTGAATAGGGTAAGGGAAAAGARADKQEPRLEALTSVLSLRPAPGTAVAYAVGAGAGDRRPLPDRVLLLVDRSRSVGPVGLSAERDVARRILESLPPATRFDALFFDRGSARLFPLARAATREAITAFEEEMVPDRLANGTDLGAALRAAGALLRREAGAFGPRLLLVVLTDGAVAPPGSGAALPAELGPLPGIELATAVVSVRAEDDRRLGPDEHHLLRSLAAAAPLGGVEREIRAGDIGDGVTALLDTLRGGGDLYTIGLAAGGAPAAVSVAEALAPAEGASGVVTLAPQKPAGAVQASATTRAAPAPAAAALMPSTLRLLATVRGQERSLGARPVPVAARWLAPHLPVAAGAPPPAPDGLRFFTAASVAALVEPVVHQPPPPPSPGVQGQMERSVVRNALSLAFGPRARACYMNRPGATPADRDLSGRVRLALDLVRGEVAAARVESSTLGRPAIETCLREAAFALDIPRAYRNDDLVRAVLNLVFRPRRDQDKATATTAARRPDPAITSEIDLMIDEAIEALGGKQLGLPNDGMPPPPAAPDAGVPQTTPKQ